MRLARQVYLDVQAPHILRQHVEILEQRLPARIAMQAREIRGVRGQVENALLMGTVEPLERQVDIVDERIGTRDPVGQPDIAGRACAIQSAQCRFELPLLAIAVENHGRESRIHAVAGRLIELVPGSRRVAGIQVGDNEPGVAGAGSSDGGNLDLADPDRLRESACHQVGTGQIYPADIANRISREQIFGNPDSLFVLPEIIQDDRSPAQQDRIAWIELQSSTHLPDNQDPVARAFTMQYGAHTQRQRVIRVDFQCAIDRSENESLGLVAAESTAVDRVVIQGRQPYPCRNVSIVDFECGFVNIECQLE